MAQVGDKIRILYMKGEPEYTGKEGIVKMIDDAGQLHGSWGGCAIVPIVDLYTILSHATPNEMFPNQGNRKEEQ